MKAIYFPEIEPKLAEKDAFSAIPQEIRLLITPIIRADGISGDFKLSMPRQTSNWVDRVVTWSEKTFKSDYMFQDLSPILVDMGKLDPNIVCEGGNHPILQTISNLDERGIPAIPVTECRRNTPYQTAVREALQFGGICALRVHGQMIKGESWRSDILRTVVE